MMQKNAKTYIILDKCLCVRCLDYVCLWELTVQTYMRKDKCLCMRVLYYVCLFLRLGCLLPCFRIFCENKNEISVLYQLFFVTLRQSRELTPSRHKKQMNLFCSALDFS